MATPARRQFLRMGALAVGGLSGSISLGQQGGPGTDAWVLGEPAAASVPDPDAREARAWDRAAQIIARVRPPSFPDRWFPVTDHGAVGDGSTDCTAAIAGAIQACHAAGGGHVLVPAGRCALTADLCLQPARHRGDGSRSARRPVRQRPLVVLDRIGAVRLAARHAQPASGLDGAGAVRRGGHARRGARVRRRPPPTAELRSALRV
ncbi:glycosyl hydrolase family 28-related protein [Actinopolymorpha alba]|uniref:glycosyl hydrolase family 28-related protein n=1 Tax=Actinopolymorpha alba TaxID=533267 RepID=UPI0003A0B232|nr:glycosyl hydrolase family 28-related protein [Actinopolymorpha alba]